MKRAPSNFDPYSFDNRMAMEIGTLMQSIGRGKRRLFVNISKSNKYALYKFMNEVANMVKGQGALPPNISEFTKYLEKESKHKNGISLTYDEINFLKKILTASIKQKDMVEFKWYQFFSKFLAKIAKIQYEAILEELKI